MSKKTVNVVETVETPVVQKPRVGARAKELLIAGEKTNQEILEILKKEYPEGKTSIACIAWYKSDLKKAKVDEDAPFKAWLKANEMKLREEFMATQVVEA
jgi:CO dehydrogenase/acetyl-CoA synthase epsilon subunit